MAAVYDAQVRNQLYEYERSLVRYPISPQRRRNKVKMLRRFLQSLSNNPMSYPICNSKVLGQNYSHNGEPLFPNLRKANYKDESNTQWRMSFFQISPNMVKIYRLMQSSNVNEGNNRIIRLTEDEFNEILTQSIHEVIKEEFDYKSTSYQAKPKSKGGLNDWELFRILSTIIGELVSDGKITKDDEQMLLHYALYNNDCWG